MNQKNQEHKNFGKKKKLRCRYQNCKARKLKKNQSQSQNAKNLNSGFFISLQNLK